MKYWIHLQAPLLPPQSIFLRDSLHSGNLFCLFVRYRLRLAHLDAIVLAVGFSIGYFWCSYYRDAAGSSCVDVWACRPVLPTRSQRVRNFSKHSRPVDVSDDFPERLQLRIVPAFFHSEYFLATHYPEVFTTKTWIIHEFKLWAPNTPWTFFSLIYF